MAKLVRHRQLKGSETARLRLRPPRHTSTLPVAIFLLAGAVVNVAVAWGLVLRDRWGMWPPLQEISVEGLGALRRNVYISPNPPVVHYSNFGVGVTLRVIGSVTVLDFEYWGNEHLFGLPMRALVYDEWHNSSTRLRQYGFWVLDNYFPYRPVWPGFAINTLFYAAILWLLIPGPFALRRLIRRRRGLCPACGYDLRHGEHKACPECGLAA